MLERDSVGRTPDISDLLGYSGVRVELERFPSQIELPDQIMSTMQKFLDKTLGNMQEYYTQFYFGKHRKKWFHGKVIHGEPLKFDSEISRMRGTAGEGYGMRLVGEEKWIRMQQAILSRGRVGFISAHTHPHIPDEAAYLLLDEINELSDVEKQEVVDAFSKLSAPLLGSLPSAKDVRTFIDKSQTVDYYSMLIYGSSGMTLLISDPTLAPGNTNEVQSRVEEYEDQIRVSDPEDLLTENLDEERQIALELLRDAVSEVAKVYFSPNSNSPILSEVA